MSDTGLRVPDLQTALPDPAAAENVAYEPSRARLRAFSSALETTTVYGSPAYVSEYRSRCADRTKNALDDEFDATDYGHVETAIEYARTNEMVCLDRRVGRHDALSFTCRYYVPREHGRIALAVASGSSSVRRACWSTPARRTRCTPRATTRRSSPAWR